MQINAFGTLTSHTELSPKWLVLNEQLLLGNDSRIIIVRQRPLLLYRHVAHLPLIETCSLVVKETTLSRGSQWDVHIYRGWSKSLTSKGGRCNALLAFAGFLLLTDRGKLSWQSRWMSFASFISSHMLCTSLMSPGGRFVSYEHLSRG